MFPAQELFRSENLRRIGHKCQSSPILMGTCSNARGVTLRDVSQVSTFLISVPALLFPFSSSVSTLIYLFICLLACRRSSTRSSRHFFFAILCKLQQFLIASFVHSRRKEHSTSELICSLFHFLPAQRRELCQRERARHEKRRPGNL